MNLSSANGKVIFLDTTMRDGEMMPGIRLNTQDKVAIAQLLDQAGIDILEVGYPAHLQKDTEAILEVSQVVKQAVVCALAGANPGEIAQAAEAVRLAERGRIHTYALVNLKDPSQSPQVLETIQQSVTLARNYCEDVEWSAFDAARSEPDFLCRAIEVAIKSGATTVNIPDSLGLAAVEDFSRLIQTVFNRVPNISEAVVSVHCHDDLGLAVENSIAALTNGVRQIECAVNGLGARKGNADLAAVAAAVANHPDYATQINPTALRAVSDLVAQITGITGIKDRNERDEAFSARG